MRRIVAGVALVSMLSLPGCASLNYLEPAGPRFAGSYTDAAPDPPGIRVVTYNIKFARNIPGAVSLLKYDPRLAGADVVLLQEMHEEGADCIARSLAMNYVYYPASRRPGTGNFGNAILSRWPIEDDRKVLLPHRGRWTKAARIGVGATVRVRDMPVRVYSVHLETIASLRGGARREQAEAIRADAAGHPHVIAAGDFNAKKVVGEVFTSDGFRWLTRDIGRTIARWSWDHVVARGFRLRDCASAGPVPNPMRASDHLPVWADLVPDDAPLDRAAGAAIQSRDCGGAAP